MKLTRGLSIAASMIGAIAISACAPLPAQSEKPSLAASARSSFDADSQVAATQAVSRPRSAIPVEFAQLSESDLKARYVHCSRDAMQRHINAGEAAHCSMIYETLLQRVFGGDFLALLAWSRGQRVDAVEEDFAASDRNP